MIDFVVKDIPDSLVIEIMPETRDQPREHSVKIEDLLESALMIRHKEHLIELGFPGRWSFVYTWNTPKACVK